MECPRLKDERRNLLGLRMHPAPFDLPDKDHVVAFLIAAAVMTFEPCERAVQHRHSRVSRRMRYPCEPVAFYGCKALA